MTSVLCLLCAKCCEKTEMLLSNADIERIEREAKKSRREFAYLKEGYFYLKNRGRYCIFLNQEKDVLFTIFALKDVDFTPSFTTLTWINAL